MTDCPSFLSKNQLVILEPQQNFLTGGGVQVDFVSGGGGLAHYADQIRPFAAKNGDPAKNDDFDLSKPYNGTIFRLPLRTKAQAKTSVISRRAYSIQQVSVPELFFCMQALEKKPPRFTRLTFISPLGHQQHRLEIC